MATKPELPAELGNNVVGGKKQARPKLQLQKYQCHKQVWAGKIAKITLKGSMTILILDNMIEWPVPHTYITKYNPVVGGWLLQMGNGSGQFG